MERCTDYIMQPVSINNFLNKKLPGRCNQICIFILLTLVSLCCRHSTAATHRLLPRGVSFHTTFDTTPTLAMVIGNIILTQPLCWQWPVRWSLAISFWHNPHAGSSLWDGPWQYHFDTTPMPAQLLPNVFGETETGRCRINVHIFSQFADLLLLWWYVQGNDIDCVDIINLLLILINLAWCWTK